MSGAAPVYDAIVIGGGPAGLSAALILGRCRRRVLVCDAGRPRNAASHALHGYLTRDGIAPAEFLRLAREDLRPYGVEMRQATVASARRIADGFEVALEDGVRIRSRKLLIATGVVDHLPDVAGIGELYGRSVFHCPYCDGWEMRDQPLAVYGRGRSGAGLALTLLAWTADVVLCSDGRARLAQEDAKRLARRGIAVRQDRLVELESTDGVLARLRFATGDPLARRALFLSTGHHQGCELAARLGCHFTGKGVVSANRLAGTNVPGLYVAGDASRDVQLVIVAAAEGAKAGFAINKALQEEAGDTPASS